MKYLFCIKDAGPRNQHEVTAQNNQILNEIWQESC